jgi:transposase
VLLLPAALRILLASGPIDLRQGIDGLMGLVQGAWKEDVYGGALFVFVSRRRDRVKILTWDNGGFVVFYKRLEAGRFRVPAVEDGARKLRIDATQLAMLLDGIDVSRVRRPMKWSPPQAGDRQDGRSLISTDQWRRASTTANGKAAASNSSAKSRRSSPTSRS